MRRFLFLTLAPTRQAWSVIGGPTALSNAVLISVTAVVLPIALINSVAFLGSDLRLTLVRVGVGIAILISALLVARRTVLGTDPRPSRPIIAALIFGFCPFMVMLILYFFTPLTLPQSHDFFDYVVMPAFYLFISLAVFAFIFGSRARAQEMNQKSYQRQAKLSGLLARHELDIVTARSDLQRQVNESLEERLREISMAVAHLEFEQKQEIEKASQLLSRTVTDIVRPLSHELAEVPKPDAAKVDGRDWWSEELDFEGNNKVPQDIDIRRALFPRGATLLYLALSILSAQSLGAPPLDIVIRSTTTLLIFVIIYSIQHTLPQRFSLLRPVYAGLVLPLIYFGAFFITRLFYLALANLFPAQLIGLSLGNEYLLTISEK